MALYIDATFGKEAQVFEDLVQIARCDPGLRTFNATYQSSGGGLYPQQYEVGYDQKQPSVVSSSRLLSLVKSAESILIVGVDSTFVTPSGAPISVYGSITIGDASYLGSLITVYLDTTDAGGIGYYCIGQNGHDIDMPRPVLLYHELSHAFHFSQGDHPHDLPNGEILAQADENAFRAQLGLPLRHPTDHFGGVGNEPVGKPFPPCKPLYTGWSPNWSCVVATAAVGSPYAPQVAALRKAKRDYLDLSPWVALIAEPVLDSYGRFGPIVVRDMHAHPALHGAMRLYAVQPVFHLVQMVETYLAAESDSPSLVEELDRSMGQYVSNLEETGGAALALTVAARAAFSAGRQVCSNRETASVDPSGLQLPDDLFNYLATIIKSSGGQTTGFAWAFEGLGLFLRQAAASFEHRVGTAPDFPDSLGAWLARLPIPPDARLSISDAPEELRVLGERLFTRAYTRELFAQHLLARWSEPSVPALRSLLRGLGYTRA